MSADLMDDVKWTVVEGIAGASTLTVITDSVDMQLFDSLMFVVAVGSNAGTVTMTMQYSEDDSTWTNYGTTTTVTVANKVSMMDLHTPSPEARYWRASVARSASAVISGVYALQYNTGVKPVTQSNDVIGTSKFLIS